MITTSNGIDVKFWKQDGFACAFMAANNCVQAELFKLSDLCKDHEWEKLQCDGCLNEFIKKCDKCPYNHKKLTIIPEKIIELLKDKHTQQN